MPLLIERPTRILFFTGKGGVGKTSTASATAIALADAGKRVLLVSTDPASNLDEVLGTSLSSTPTAIPGVPGLCALNVDPIEAARQYRERMVAPYRGVLPAAAVASIEEQLSGACTVEIAAFGSSIRGPRFTWPVARRWVDQSLGVQLNASQIARDSWCG